MANLFENPIGTDGFEFVEFTAPEPQKLAAYFERIGFTAVGKHRSKNVVRYKQNDINFILNMEPTGQPDRRSPCRPGRSVGPARTGRACCRADTRRTPARSDRCRRR